MTDDTAMIARIRALADQIEPIQGWLDKVAGSALYQLARLRAPVPTVVELGSWKGRSTAWLAAGILDRGEGRVIAVDTWAGTTTENLHANLLAGYGPDQLHQEFLGNMTRMGVRAQVEDWRMTTLQAAQRWDRGPSIGLLHVDASHEYDDVRADFEYWAPHVARGGIIVFDDVPSWPGPSRLVSELPRWYQFLGSSPNQWWVRKA